MPRSPSLVVAAVVLIAGALTGCADAAGHPDTDPPQPSSTTTTEAVAPAPVEPPPAVPPSSGGRAIGIADDELHDEPGWVVGAEPLPLRPDGFGEILPTPAVLVERSLPTTTELPAPTSEEFEHTIGPIDDSIRVRMGETWSPECPVGLDELRYVTVSFWGFDGGHHTGELVVHRDVAEDLTWVFEQLHAARFPLEEMRLVTTADLDAPATGDGNNTAAYVCRPVRSGSSWSEHARGLAIDVNPFHNPYVRGDVVLPELASSYLDRSWHRPGMIRSGDVVTEAFSAIGWRWGGSWSSPDLMHFSATGR